jgi:hypothetical protein
MSSNAGGFGRIKFENAAALDAWKKSKVSHADFEDWPETFVTDRTKPFVIEKKLAELAKPRSSGVLDIAIDANSAELIMDVEEETFNDHVGEIATLFRASAAHGGKGTIVFLGTAGAEEDFAFELLVDKKKSRVSELCIGLLRIEHFRRPLATSWRRPTRCTRRRSPNPESRPRPTATWIRCSPPSRSPRTWTAGPTRGAFSPRRASTRSNDRWSQLSPRRPRRSPTRISAPS